MTNPDPKQPSPLPDLSAAKPADESIKETIESIVIAFILAFVFRAYVVEAFVIPTGSMAPTLLGEHVRVRSDQSGYNFAIDRDIERSRSPAVDPMTFAPVEREPGTRTGDRILVQKYIYAVSEPRRWDVVVFKNPEDPYGPSQNYIKRLIALPGESVRIVNGNIYIRTGTEDWQIARKTDRPKVQRAVWQPIYHSQYIPLDGGRDRPAGYEWKTPWVAHGETAGQWEIDGRRDYRFNGDGAGRIAFDFARGGYDTGAAMYPYNQPGSETDPIEDVRVAATFQPDAPGLSVKLSTTARLNSTNTIEILTVEIDATGALTLIATNPDTGRTTRLDRRRQVAPFRPGRNTAVELWYVDQEASVWIDGDLVARVRFAPVLMPVEWYRQNSSVPAIAIETDGSAVTLHNVELDRDIYYGSWLNDGRIALGGMVYRSGRVDERPLRLEDDEFFCLGDNSPRSLDGRAWSRVHPWVSTNSKRGQLRPGVVPRDMMVGHAFMVYFPAPYPWKPNAPGIFPNFGAMRFIH